MKIQVFENPDILGREAAMLSVEIIRHAIKEKGKARIILSTGASQFDFFKHFVLQKLEWERLEVFHLDEYVGLPITHSASFRKYITDRFLQYCHVGKFYPVNGEGDVEYNIAKLSQELEKEPIDLGLIGIGENAHIAFNDPPADFTDKRSYKIVQLDQRCKAQQVGEKWFSSVDQVPNSAITMTPYRIMQCKTIISCVPYVIKADAIKNTMEHELSNMVPATILKNHSDWYLFLDQDSHSKIKNSSF